MKTIAQLAAKFSEEARRAQMEKARRNPRQVVWGQHSPFTIFKRVESIDAKGKVGQQIVAESLNQGGYEVIAAVENLPYDLLVRKNQKQLRLEVKTSTLDNSGKFQNEGVLMGNHFDALCFLMISPDEARVLFVPREEIPYEELHDRGRRGTGKGFKWDFALKEPPAYTAKKPRLTAIVTADDLADAFNLAFGGYFNR